MKGGMGAPGGDLPDGFAGKELKGEIGRDNLPDTTGGDVIVGTPDEGTTQSATESKDSANYETYAECLDLMLLIMVRKIMYSAVQKRMPAIGIPIFLKFLRSMVTS